MVASDFDYAMVLDADGVLMVRMTGTFDVGAFIQKREAVVARDFAGIDISTNPIVVDLSGVQPSPSDWLAQAKALWAYKDARPERPYRRAVVFSNNPGLEMALNFAIETKQHFRSTPLDIRSFTTIAEARVWVLDGWQDNRSQ